jgi:hypothetical protein
MLDLNTGEPGFLKHFLDELKTQAGGGGNSNSRLK